MEERPFRAVLRVLWEGHGFSRADSRLELVAALAAEASELKLPSNKRISANVGKRSHSKANDQPEPDRTVGITYDPCYKSDG